MRRIVTAILAGFYLSAILFFAFRPFEPIRGLQYAAADLEFTDGALHVQRDASIENRRDVAKVRDALMQSGCLSVELVVQTDSLMQLGAANIFGMARDSMNRNFTVGQEGSALVFRMRTSATDFGGYRNRLLVPQVFDTEHRQHVLLTYDGKLTRLYVNGLLRATSPDPQGNFANWGRNHILVAGDLPAGGDGWAGKIWRAAVYDAALDAAAAWRMFNGKREAEPVVAYDFSDGRLPKGMKKLHYRNLFITVDPAAYDLYDCLFNIVAFAPLGILVYLSLPLRFERRKVLAVIVVPMLIGLLAGGTIEFFQRFVIGRVPCLPDLIYNATGALMGGLFGWLFHSSFENKTKDGSSS